MRRDDGRLLHTWRSGEAKLDAYLDDYAALANSLVTLYEATGRRTLDRRGGAAGRHRARASLPIRPAADSSTRPAITKQLLTRTKELTDSSVPSGNALAATALLRLGKLLGRRDYLDAAASDAGRGGADHAAGADGRRADAAGARSAISDRVMSWCSSAVAGKVEGVLAAIETRYLPRSVFARRSGQAESAAARRACLRARRRPTASRCSMSVRTSLARSRRWEWRRLRRRWTESLKRRRWRMSVVVAAGSRRAPGRWRRPAPAAALRRRSRRRAGA